MKPVLTCSGILFALLFSTPALASPWSDLEPGMLVHLNGDLDTGTGVTLPKGSKLAVNDRDFQGPPYVESLSLRLFPCPSDLESKKIPLTLLKDTYGFEMGQGCQIGLYLEVKDYYKESFFEIDPQ
jgi:hypothetical protein